MKFGVREICDVVLKAKAAQKVGNKIFYKDEPVIYFDTLKTSSLEGAATTVYAQGGKGNPRLVAWEGERTVTFTMEDALISPESFSILSGAGLISPSNDKPIRVHVTERTADITKDQDGKIEIKLDQRPYYKSNSDEQFVYVMLLKNGEVYTEPFLIDTTGTPYNELEKDENGSYSIYLKNTDDTGIFDEDSVVLVDYYTEKTEGVQQIDISPDKFGGNYYLEADTLFRDQNGVDMPATFIIPNCKIQSNFTFNMAASGDPSTFTFTMDAFPDYTRFDKTKKVLASIQMLETSVDNAEALRDRTKSAKTINDFGELIDDPNPETYGSGE